MAHHIREWLPAAFKLVSQGTSEKNEERKTINLRQPSIESDQAQGGTVRCNGNMVRAGVPQSLAMTISGHKTASMFQQYNVTSGTDQVEALKKTAAPLAALPKSDEKPVLEMPQVVGGK